MNITDSRSPFQSRIKSLVQRYPRQFWLMFFGMLISTIGTSMIWPFMMIYVSGKLGLPLSQIGILLTIQSAVSLISSFTTGPIVDRLGRKWVMILGLLSHGASYLLLNRAETFPAFAGLMALTGAVSPLYRIAGDAMMADLVPPEKRVDAYALLRMSNNLGIAVGPAIGGVIAATSYNLAFYAAAIGLSTYSLLLLFFAVETMPKQAQIRSSEAVAPIKREPLGGYAEILQHKSFMRFVGVFSMVQICATLIWVLLGVYAKENYGIRENQYGLIPTTNAIMVVTLQILVTGITKRYRLLPMMAVGAFFYATANASIALSTQFWMFWLSMVIMTIGELVLVPNSSTYAANLAPPDKRGRYMSMYGLTWGVASGIGPVIGGLLNDWFSPQAIWIGGAIVGYTSVALFLWMEKTAKKVNAG
jgi:MFS family permease